jgi:hypothetical protein
MLSELTKVDISALFYHGQDVERAIGGQGLMLAFDHVEG